MTDSNLRTQTLAACDEMIFVASELPSGCVPRLAIIGLAETLRREFNLTDQEKREIVLQRLARFEPVGKSELPEFLDFSRAESKRIIDSLIVAGLIEQYQAPSEDGRPRTMLQLP